MYAWHISLGALTMKNRICKSIQKWVEKRKGLYSTVSVLQKPVKICQNQIKEILQENEKLEQYLFVVRLFVRIDGDTTVDNEISDEVFDKMK